MRKSTLSDRLAFAPVANHDRITLPAALVPRGDHEQYSRSSLTLATLRALEIGAPVEASLATCISQYREFFHGIPAIDGAL